MRFNGGKTSSLKEEFAERKKYKESAMRNYSSYVIDTWYQYPNYGFLNEHYEPVVTLVGGNFENLTNFGDFASPDQRVLPFVAKAFNNFRDVFLKRAESPNFNVPKYFGTLVPQKTYESFDLLYRQYINKLKQDMGRGLDQNNSDRSLRYVLENIKVFPITQSGFALSRHCPISTTGLAIELAKMSYTFDSTKGDLIATNTFECFLKDAKESGFYVDKNNPWRLIANLESPQMRDLLLQYKEDTKPEFVLARFFRKKTHYEDIQDVYRFFNKSLTLEQLLRYTVIIRIAETGMDPSMEEEIYTKAYDIYKLYSNNYPSDPFKGSSAIIAEYCTKKIKEIHVEKESIDSYTKTTLKEYM